MKIGTVAVCLCSVIALLLAGRARAQETLGSVNGTVTDSSGAVVQQVTVKIHNVGTGLDVSASTKEDGSFNFVGLPIGTYTVTFSRDGFKTDVHTQILVRGDLTTTINATLQAGSVSSTVTVAATPLLNETDTTNGYTLSSTLIESIPLGTGSFTQLALLSPGVSADLLSGSGTNAGLGNQSIFANGQRDSSNSFALNGVDVNNLFNGKTSSSVSDSRFVSNTGESSQPGGELQTSTSVYDAIGQGLPTPPPETIEELHVSTSMYDASEGAYSGAHISLQTRSGTNDFHGQAYEYVQTSAWNAAPFFRNADPSIPASQKVPALNRNTFGATIGGPIWQNKLFFFASYQGQRASDQDSSVSDANVPPSLSDTNRTAAGLAAAANTDFGTSLSASQVDAVALAIMNAKLPNGNYVIPSPTISNTATMEALGYDSLVQGPSTTFSANQVNGNIDYNLSSTDRLSGKYYYQRTPTYAPFAISQLGGFPQLLDAGGQAFSLRNTTIVTPNVVWNQRFGFIREVVYANTQQQFTNSSFGINIFGLDRVPGIDIGVANPILYDGLDFGPSTNFANAGVFQNEFEGATDLTWTRGKHTLSFGAQWDHIQLNVINKNDEAALLSFSNFPNFLTGAVCSPTNVCDGLSSSILLNGETNRYYRANQTGAYALDNFRLKSNLTLNLGLRWDWDGPLAEEHGFLTNFYPQDYNYDSSADTIQNIGLVVAGNNSAFGSKGVSASTITGRQWGFAPRIGAVYAPSFLKNFVMRAGFGMYYDRGEYFTMLSPSAGSGISGPFGVTTEQPFVVPFYAPATATFESPFGTTPPPPPPNSLAGIASEIPNIAQLIANTTPFCTSTGQSRCGPLQFAGFDPRNTLPYTENWTLDIQWQPVNDIVMDLAYVGNHGVHQVVSVPFNEPGIATTSNPINGQAYSYGYTVPGVGAENVSTLVSGYATGNASIRVPYVGYDPNSQYYESDGLSNYNALQFSVTKRMSHGLTVAGSYTWSHALDEQSGEGLFPSSNDPLNLRDAYGNSDFDRTHVFIVSYRYELPKAQSLSGFASQIVNGWGLSGVTVAQSGEPYSIVDYTGAVGAILYGGGDYELGNPIVPIGGVGATSTKVKLQGTTGVNPGMPLLNVGAFGIPLLSPGQMGVPPCDPSTGACDSYETGFGTTGRNIFRAPFQSRFDFSLFKNFKINERFNLRYDVQAFNIFNHPSFDAPSNNIKFNPYYLNPPDYTGYSNFTPCVASTGAYVCPPSGQLGVIQHTIGSPRFLQMALHLTF